MGRYGYEIKFGKHIAFRKKVSKDLLEQRPLERIIPRKKSKSRKGYEHWAIKYNLKKAASTLIEIRNKCFNSIEELERGISRISIEKNELKREFDMLSWE